MWLRNCVILSATPTQYICHFYMHYLRIPSLSDYQMSCWAKVIVLFGLGVGVDSVSYNDVCYQFVVHQYKLKTEDRNIITQFNS